MALTHVVTVEIDSYLTTLFQLQKYRGMKR